MHASRRRPACNLLNTAARVKCKRRQASNLLPHFSVASFTVGPLGCQAHTCRGGITKPGMLGHNSHMQGSMVQQGASTATLGQPNTAVRGRCLELQVALCELAKRWAARSGWLSRFSRWSEPRHPALNRHRNDRWVRMGLEPLSATKLEEHLLRVQCALAAQPSLPTQNAAHLLAIARGVGLEQW